MREALPQPAAGEDWVVRYEQLRNDVLSQANGGGFGLILLLRQGMTAWMRACSCALAPVPAPTGKSVHFLNAVSSLPCGVRAEAAVILAGILLSHPKETLNAR